MLPNSLRHHQPYLQQYDVTLGRGNILCVKIKLRKK